VSTARVSDIGTLGMGAPWHDPWRLGLDPWRLEVDPWRLDPDPWRLDLDPLEA
jgi:hypothetical protein